MTGAPKDGFLLNTLKTLLRLSRVLLGLYQMHSNRRYKICHCSIFLGQLQTFRNFNGFSAIFPKILDVI